MQGRNFMVLWLSVLCDGDIFERRKFRQHVEYNNFVSPIRRDVSLSLQKPFVAWFDQATRAYDQSQICLIS